MARTQANEGSANKKKKLQLADDRPETKSTAALPTRYSATHSTTRTGSISASSSSSSSSDSSSSEAEAEEPTLADRVALLSTTPSSSSNTPVTVQSSGTLASSLVQALHSGDEPLLESVLAHENQKLIRGTVQRVKSGHLVLRFLEELVGRIKDATGRRGRTLAKWMKETLVVHVGFLVTAPSLVNKLAKLHSSLSARVAVRPVLEALEGRLELVASRIEAGRERIQQPQIDQGKDTGRRYVEGESDDSDASEEVVGLGGEEEEEEDSEEEEGPVVNGFLDLEASEEESDEEFNSDKDMSDFDEEDDEEDDEEGDDESD